MRFVLILVCMVGISACHVMDKPKTTMDVNMHNDTGDKVGTATLSENPDGVHIDLDVKGLSPGFHGIHIHEKASCKQPDFISAGNHFNPKKKEHGLLHPKGAHLGDLKNIEATKDGKVKKELTVKGTTLLNKNTSKESIRGTSLIITSDPDDGMTQVSGDAGKRIVCGEIKETKQKKE